LEEIAEPAMTNLSSLSVATSAPGATAAAAPQSQGSPLLGQICPNRQEITFSSNLVMHDTIAGKNEFGSTTRILGR